MKVSIRPLVRSDARASYEWRNDKRIWQYTGSSPDCLITLEIELEWIEKVLARKNEKRFAICVGDIKKHIGNIQLTSITLEDAEFHIFIGNSMMHGQGIGTAATSLILSYAKESLGLKEIYLYVHQNNQAAIRVYEKIGFKLTPSDDVNRLKYIYKL